MTSACVYGMMVVLVRTAAGGVMTTGAGTEVEITRWKKGLSDGRSKGGGSRKEGMEGVHEKEWNE